MADYSTPRTARFRENKRLAVNNMRRCTVCNEIKPLWEFSVREDGRLRAQCRTCHAASHKEQQSTTPETVLARAIIRDRLGDLPNGCITAPTSVGQPPIYCPWYEWCKRALSSEDQHVCEVEDELLGIPAYKEGPQKPESEYPWYIQP